VTIRSVPPTVDFVDLERRMLAFWRDSEAFNKLRTLRAGGPKWHFLDGPITANNPMGIHHAWGRTYKDVWQRYNAMLGHELRWQNGFDCQGLWVEVNVERELGLQNKRDIEKIGVSEFIVKCKQRVLTYSAKLTEQSIRLGMWMDWNDPADLLKLRDRLGEDPLAVTSIQGADGPVTSTIENLVGHLGAPEIGGSYFTFSDENNYSIWGFLKRCWERGLIYTGTDVMPWCTRCGTGLSQHEIATDGYEELTHESVYVALPVRGRPGTALLIWTTTPWTLASNTVAAVNPNVQYVEVQQGEHTYYLGEHALERVLQQPYTIKRRFSGEELVGLSYDGPFDELPIVQKFGIPAAHTVLAWNDVAEDEGTGIVHISPGSGAEDFVLGKGRGLPILAPLTEDGNYLEGFGWLTGRSVHDVAPSIFEDLRTKGMLYRTEPITHRYPVCWRCREELVFRLVDEWYISMGARYDKPRSEVTAAEKTASLRYQIMDITEPIQWIPKFGREREFEWLQQMNDWMISKKRYWGLALPIWTCSRCASFEVIGSKEELHERAVEGWEEFDGHSPHRPFVDLVKISCATCGELMSRIPEVGNPWLDAGIVSFSSTRYRTDREYFEHWFPADFITESFPGQFRNWFYAVLAMSAVLEERTPYLAVLGYALLVGEDGRPMHKSWGNAIDFNEGVDTIGADVTRWMFCAHPPDRNLPFGYSLADQTRRTILNTLWNVYSFFCGYANIDKWTPDPDFSATSEMPLDTWIYNRLHETVETVTAAMGEFSGSRATASIASFIDDLSNWYVRRSRRRFWQSKDSADKALAMGTLHYVLVTLVKLMAPLVPFVTEEMYQNLVRSHDEAAPESVHHCLWPTVPSTPVDRDLLDDMAFVRRLASLGHNARGQAKIKVRQPLSRADVFGSDRTLPPALATLLADELNVKDVAFCTDLERVFRHKIVPDIAYWGRRLKSRLPDLRSALEYRDTDRAADRLLSGQDVALTLDDGTDVILTPENCSVSREPRDGYAVSVMDGQLLVALDTTVDRDLRLEGLARDFVRRVQTLRKDLGLRIDDRIHTIWAADGSLPDAIAAHAEYIKSETLSLTLEPGDPSVRSAREFSGTIAENRLKIGIYRAED
jgi:isoleucyl-tRNA synthetase